MAKRGIVLRHWDSRMLSDPIKNKWDQPLHPALLQAQLKPIQKQLRFVAAPESGCLVSFIEPFSYLSGTLFVPWKAVLLILWSPPPPFAFSAAQFSVFPKDVSILTVPSTSQTSKQMVFLITYLSLFLKPHHCGHSVWYSSSPGCFLFEAYFYSPVIRLYRKCLICECLMLNPRVL